MAILASLRGKLARTAFGRHIAFEYGGGNSELINELTMLFNCFLRRGVNFNCKDSSNDCEVLCGRVLWMVPGGCQGSLRPYTTTVGYISAECPKTPRKQQPWVSWIPSPACTCHNWRVWCGFLLELDIYCMQTVKNDIKDLFCGWQAKNTISSPTCHLGNLKQMSP